MKRLIIIFFILFGFNLFSQSEEIKNPPISKIIEELENKIGLEMNNKNYEYIYNNILPKYNSEIRKLNNDKQLKKYYDARIDACQIRLDNARHNFLKTFSKQLEEDIKNNNIERKEAFEKASQIVHYSNDKIDKDGLMGLLPSFLGGDTTYYKYWNNIRENLIKKIEKKFN
ncbi:hypothetical protein [Brachyspira pilosicoli]|uniref:hypothetical protein n=1 Tax=Brachyspira pilosicoli TaxID=52584 RepID=UPI002666738A|nr:hypothetical protein [Brachyspira pilosicoli]